MKKSIICAGIALATFLTISCVPDKDIVERADFDEPELSVVPESVTLGLNAGSTATVTIETDQEKISAEVDYNSVSWLSATLSGKTLTVKAEAGNKTGSIRKGLVRIIVGEKGVTKEYSLVVNQETGDPETLELSKNSVTFNETAGQSEEITYTTNLGSISISQPEASKTWLSVTSDATKITLATIAANGNEDDNTAVVTVTAGSINKDINVRQTGVRPFIELSVASVTLAKDKDSEGSITFTTNQPSVTAEVPSSAASWLSATVGEGTISFKALSANSELTPRTAEVDICAGSAKQTVSVTQNGDGYLGKDYGTAGIIFWVDPENPKHYKVVSAKSEQKMWCTEKGRVDGLGDLYKTPVEANAYIRNLPGYANGEYPAFKYCEDMGTEWYIPNQDEMKALAALYCGVATYEEVYVDGVATNGPADQLAARQAFDNRLKAFDGGVALNSAGYDANGDACVLCQETSTGYNYSFRWGKIAVINNHAKNGNRYARCVKEVTEN